MLACGGASLRGSMSTMACDTAEPVPCRAVGESRQPSGAKLPVALQRREFNIVSNDYVRDHEKKAEAEAQRTKAELVDKFWRAPPRPAARTAMHAASLGHSFGMAVEAQPQRASVGIGARLRSGARPVHRRE